MIVPYPALGDVTVCIRLAQTLTDSGYRVTLFSDILKSSNKNFEWLDIQCLPSDFEALFECFDIYLLDILAPWVKKRLQQFSSKSESVFFFTAKDFPEHLDFQKKEIEKTSRSAGFLINRPFCLKPNSGQHMIDWVDDYAKEMFGITACPQRPSVTFCQPLTDKDHVVIFPTTPNVKKNFSSRGFYKLAKRLSDLGMKIEIVGMPHEKESLEKVFEGFNVRAFSDISQLIEYLRAAVAVISNDSGGGHLAAMLGVPTITITRKNKDFVWRPGYDLGNVITPDIVFKAGGGHIWRPFVSLNKIIKIVQNIKGGCKS